MDLRFPVHSLLFFYVKHISRIQNMFRCKSVEVIKVHTYFFKCGSHHENVALHYFNCRDHNWPRASAAGLWNLSLSLTRESTLSKSCSSQQERDNKATSSSDRWLLAQRHPTEFAETGLELHHGRKLFTASLHSFSLSPPRGICMVIWKPSQLPLASSPFPLIFPHKSPISNPVAIADS